MEKMVVLFALLLAFPILEQGDKTKVPEEKPKAEKPEAPKTMSADDGFVQQYEQVIALNKVILDIEQENGIPKMRERAQKMVQQLTAWMHEHKVDGWRYDPATKTFTEIKKPDKN